MRLPWPFGRGTTSDGPAPDKAAPPHAEADAAASAPVADAAPTGAWASLPPIQRTVGSPPLVAPAAPFLDAVPGHRPLPPIVQPLGHEVATSAPAGLVAAHVAPVPSLTSHAAMPTRHVQRRSAGTSTWTDPEPAADAPAPVPAAAQTAAPEPSPVRHVAPVAATRVVTPAVRPLTVAPPIPAASRAPVAQRSAAATPPAGAAPAAVTGPGMPVAARATTPTRSRWSEAASPERPGLAAPLGTATPLAATGPTASPAPASDASFAAPSATTPSIPGPTSAPSGAAPSMPTVSRKAGLGAPMREVPPTAIQRSPGPGGLPLAQGPMSAAAIAHSLMSPSAGQASGVPGMPVVARSASDGHHAGDGHAHDAQASAAPSGLGERAARPLPVLPVARQRAAGAPPDAGRDNPSPATGGQRAATSPPTVARSAAPTPAAPVVLPLLGARPLRPTVVLQRDTDEQGATAGHDEPVVARWSAAETLPESVESLPRAGGGTPDAVPLQRLTAPAAAVPTAVPSASPTAQLGGMSGFDGGLPRAGHGSTPQGVTGPALQRSSAAPPLRATPAPVDPGPPLPLQLARPAPTVAPAATLTPAPVIQRIEAGPLPASTPVVQTSPAAGMPALPQFTASPVVQRIEGAAPDPGTGGDQRSDGEIDELAKKMFGRLRGQLRAEMINEREARGLSFDAF